MKCLTVVGARPQFIKAAPLSLVLRKRHQEILVHTGQHYDDNMSGIFFDEMKIPSPDYYLGIGSNTHGAQTGSMLMELEAVMLKEQPQVVIVYGDTNSTLAGALAAAKLQIPVAHIEAGMRSYNRAMPEEINRILTDHLSSFLFVPSEISYNCLLREGINANVHIVGDIMYDVILLFRTWAEKRSRILLTLALKPKSYYLGTIHRAENTDHPERLGAIFDSLARLEKPVILPLHPRTHRKIREFGIRPDKNIRIVEPLGYLDMIKLQSQAECILTDSGGVQKEAYYLEVPCVTLRTETEWVETVTAGWNIVCDAVSDDLVAAVRKLAGCQASHPSLYGDGNTAGRIVKILECPGQPLPEALSRPIANNQKV